MFLGIFPASLGITIEKYTYLHVQESGMLYGDNLDDISKKRSIKK